MNGAGRPLLHPDAESELGPLPARALQGPTPFCTIQLCLKVEPDDRQRSRAGGHDVNARRAEVPVELMEIRRRIIDELDALLRVLNHRADFTPSLVLRFHAPSQTPWWREFEG